MNVFSKTVRSLTRASSWVGMFMLFTLMIFIPLGVITRSFHYPILGDVEIVQLAMIVLIMFGLGYTQSEDGHIAIGLLVDRFSPRAQAIYDVVAYALTMAFCWIISWVFIGDSMDNMLGNIVTTDLLNIPFYPFKFCVVIGFFLWGLESLLKVVISIQILINGNFTVDKKTNQGADGL